MTLPFVLVALLCGQVLAKPVLAPAHFGGEDVSCSGQAGETGKLLRPFAVQVTRAGRPVENVPVRFSVEYEPWENRRDGSPAGLSDTLTFTDKQGVARASLRLGGAVGEYRVAARASGQEVILSAIGLRRNWYVVTAVELAGGLALFLFGLYYGSKGLRRLAGERLRQLLFSLTANRFLGALVGVVVTAVFQSSSATAVLLVGLTSAGILTLTQSLAVILGADIGTTVTVQVLAFRLFDYALIIAVAGFVLMNAHRRLKTLGQAVFGFGLVFYSLKVVLGAAEPLRYVPWVAESVVRFASVPWLGLILAMLFTALVRSSAATIGIVVGLSFTGLIDLRAAIPYILGANIGTSSSALLASLRGTVEARRIAFGHLLFKVAIVALALPFLPWLVRLVELTARDVPRQIANGHTLINVAAALLFLPLLTPFQKLLIRLVPAGRRESFGPRYIDASSLEAPELAVAQATREVLRMGDRVLGMFQQAMEVFVSRDKEGRRALIARDDEVDRLEESITAYLARISQEELNERLSRKTTALLHIADELEHVADIVSKNFAAYARKRIEDGLSFSEEGLKEITAFHAEVTESLQMAVACVATWDADLARRLVERKDRALARQHELHNRHLKRLGMGLKETVDTSTVHLDVISDLERANFHCAQIGAAVLAAAGRTPPPKSD